jgi:enolase
MSARGISGITAREIVDHRGWPTVQADVWVDGRLAGRADVPAGRSTGSNEACVLLAGDGRRVSRAVLCDARGMLRSMGWQCHG